MCELCKNIKKGCHQGLAFDTRNVFDHINKIDEHELSIYIGRDEDGNYMLSGRYYIDDAYNGTILASNTRIPIKYCPFCGAKLQHRARVKYPWND